VESVTIENQAAFVEKLDAHVDVPTLGRVRLDIAYGGMWCAQAGTPAYIVTLFRGFQTLKTANNILILYPLESPILN
jgi:proline racemase